VHQAARPDLLGGVVGKLVGDGDVAAQVLYQDLEEAVQLEEGEAGLGAL